jgi:hypothetical protein
MAIRSKPSKPSREPARKRKSDHVQRDPTLWSDLRAIAAEVPDEELAKLPTDGARNLDHYLYGTPKKDP